MGSAVESASNYVAGQASGAAALGAKVAQTVPAAILRAPGQIVGGTLDTLADVDKWATDNISPSFLRSTPVGPALQAATAAKRMNGGASLADTLSARSSLGQVGDPGINQGTTQAVAIAGSFLTGGGEAKAATSIVPRVAQLLASSAKMGLATAITADTQDPGERVKQGLEGAAVNVVAEPLIGLLSSYIKAKPPTRVSEATPAEAASDNLDRAFASARTTEARFQAQENPTQATKGAAPTDAAATAQDAPTMATGEERPAPLQSALPQGTRHGDGLEVGGDTYKDANAALEASGAAERVDPSTHPLTPAGKIPVEAATKAAADDAGLGRAFARREDTPPAAPMIFKEEDPQGGSRVVGVIDKESLQGFKDDVDANRFDAENLTDTTASHPAGSWKLSTLGAPYDVGPFLRALADQLPERGEALSDEAVMTAAKANADAIGWDPADMIAYAAHVAGDAKQLPEVMATVRTVYARAASTVDGLLDAHSDLEPASRRSPGP
ncbi:hypothetical protein [Phenylobacterium sp.]|uniref:hypothetical protein n=1 Tax=Phenylobacterium sp. TaxID=1871053 RepID=UPI00356386CB